MYAPVATYQQRAVNGCSGYYGRGYSATMAARMRNPPHHYYHGAAGVTTPTVYSYRFARRLSSARTIGCSRALMLCAKARYGRSMAHPRVIAMPPATY